MDAPASRPTSSVPGNPSVFGNGLAAMRAFVGSSRWSAPTITRADRKSTRLNSSHPSTSYAVFGLKKKLREALALWRGPAYQEVAGEAWARAESTRLEVLRLIAWEALGDAELAAGRHA